MAQRLEQLRAEQNRLQSDNQQARQELNKFSEEYRTTRAYQSFIERGGKQEAEYKLGRQKQGQQKLVDRRLAKNNARLQELKTEIKIAREAESSGRSYGEVKEQVQQARVQKDLQQARSRRERSESQKQKGERNVQRNINRLSGNAPDAPVRISRASQTINLRGGRPGQPQGTMLREDQLLGGTQIYTDQGGKALYVNIDDINKNPEIKDFIQKSGKEFNQVSKEYSAAYADVKDYERQQYYSTPAGQAKLRKRKEDRLMYPSPQEVKDVETLWTTSFFSLENQGARVREVGRVLEGPLNDRPVVANTNDLYTKKALEFAGNRPFSTAAIIAGGRFLAGGASGFLGNTARIYAGFKLSQAAIETVSITGLGSEGRRFTLQNSQNLRGATSQYFASEQQSVGQRGFISSTLYEIPGVDLVVRDGEAGRAGAQAYLQQRGLSPQDVAYGTNLAERQTFSNKIGTAVAFASSSALTELYGRQRITAQFAKGLPTSKTQTFIQSFNAIAPPGVAEGGVQALGQQQSRGQPLNVQNLAIESTIGGVTAGTIAGGIGVAQQTGATTIKTVLTTGANIVDPYEGIGDALASSGTREATRLGVITPTPTTGLFTQQINLGRNQLTGFQSPLSFSFASERGFSSSALTFSFASERGFSSSALTGGRSQSPTLEGVSSSSSFSNTRNNPFTQSRSNPLSAPVTATNPTTATSTNTISSPLTNPFTNTATQTRPTVPTSSNTLSNTLTYTISSTPQPKIPFAPIGFGSDLFDFGLGRRGKAKKRVRSRYSPSFTGIALGLPRRASKTTPIFSGFEIRGV